MLKAFIKRPEVKLILVSDEAEDYFNDAKGPRDGPPLAEMESKDTGLLYKELMDEACDYVDAGLTLH